MFPGLLEGCGASTNDVPLPHTGAGRLGVQRVIPRPQLLFALGVEALTAPGADRLGAGESAEVVPRPREVFTTGRYRVRSRSKFAV